MRRVVAVPFPDPSIADAQSFGRAVRAARTSSGFSLEAAAEALGISKATLGDLEGGKGTVALGTAIHVARELGAALFVTPRSAHFQATNALESVRDSNPAPWGMPNTAPPSPVQPRAKRARSA